MRGSSKAFVNQKSISFDGHTHDDRYYTESEVNNLLSGKAASSHNHSASQITSGTLPINRGGTGETTLTGLKSLLNLDDNTYLKWKNGTVAGNNSKTLTVSTGLSSLVAVFAIMANLSASDETNPSKAVDTYWFWIYNFPYYIDELYHPSTISLKMKVSRSTSSGGTYQLEFRDTYLDGNGFQSDDRIYYLLLY